MNNQSFMKTSLFLFIFTLMITACGDTSNKFTLSDGAMDTLTKYVSGEGSAPTIATYESLGIQGINEKNIDELNLFLTTLAEDYNGNLHIAWQHAAYGKKGIIIQKYNTQSLSWEEPSNMLKDEESVRAPSLTIDSSGFVTLTALYDSTPGETDADDVKMYRCVNAPSIQYHVNINVLDSYGNPTYMDLNVTSHTNNDFMAIHSYGLYTFATTFLDNTYYEIEVETLPYADHPECIFIDKNLANLGTYLYGKIESSDANITINCSGNSLAKKL